jgi:hypothetical protein
VRHRGAPSAKEASFSEPGTSRSTTSDARITIGSIITLIASAAARPDRGSPRVRTTNARMNSPATMDGSAVIASATVRTYRGKAPLVSLRNTAHVTPSGTTISSAIVISMRVPTAACRMPPTVSGSSGPACCMSLVKKFRCPSASRPRRNVKKTMNTSAISARNPRLCTTTEAIRSRTVRPSSSRNTSTPYNARNSRYAITTKAIKLAAGITRVTS